MGLRAAIAFSAAGLSVLVLGALFRSLARRQGRRWPRTSGGLVFLVAVPIGLAAAVAIPDRAWVILGGAVCMALFGLVRDRRAVPPWVVFVVTVLVAMGVTAGSGLRFPLDGVPAVDFLWTVVWLAAVGTAVASSGNADGQFASTAAASTVGILVLAGFGLQSVAATSFAALTGALLAFLAYNARPASLYTGRAGTCFVGFMVAAGALWVHPSISRPGSMIISLLLVAVPLLDGTIVLLSRLRRRRRLTVRLRDHLAHRLVAVGVRPSRTIVLLALVQLACSLLAIFAGRGVLSLGVVSVVAAVLLLALAVVAMRARMRDESVPGFSLRVRLVFAGLVVFAVIASGIAALSAISSRSDLMAGRDLAEAAIKAASDGNSEKAIDLFAQAEEDFEAADSRLGSVANVPSLVVPVVGSNMHAARELTRVGLDLSRAGRDLSEQINSDQMRFVDGRVPVEHVVAVAPNLDRAALVIESSKASMDDLSTGYLVSEMKDGVKKLRSKLDGAAKNATTAASAARIAPALLGQDEPRRYLLLVQNPAELRGTGGLIGNWGIVTASDGKMHIESMERIAVLNQAGDPNARSLNAPKEYRDRYSRFDPARSLQNTNISPDFPTVAKVMSDQYQQATGQSVDGVIAVDPLGLSALLELTGPVSVEGWPTRIASENVVDVTLRDAYQRFARTPERADFLGDVARVTIDEATTGDLGSLDHISKVLTDAAHEGHLTLWFPDADEAGVVEAIEIGGRVPRSVGDSLAVSNSNAGANKLDYYLDRAIDYSVTVSPSANLRRASVDGSVTVQLDNNVPDGLPQIAAGPYEGATDRFVYGQNHSFLSVYSPLSYTGARVDDSSRGLEAAPELGRNVYSTFVDVFAGDSTTATVDLSGEVALRDGWYDLTVVRQPTLRPDTVTVRIEVPEGFEIVKAPGLTVDGRVASGEFNLARNRTFRVKIGVPSGADLWSRLEAGS